MEKSPLCDPWIQLPSCSMNNACWLLLLKNSTSTSQRPLMLAAGRVISVDRGLRFRDRTLYTRSATIASSPGCIIHAVMVMAVVPGSGSLARPPPPPPLPIAIRGLVLANSSATSSPVMWSFAGSHATTSEGLRLERPVGSRTAVFTLSITDTRFEMLSSQESHVLHSP